MSATQGTAGAADQVPQEAARIKPLSASETLSAALQLYRNNAPALWKVVAMVIVPIEIIDVIVRRVTLPSDVFLYHGTFYTHGATTSSTRTVALLLVALLGLLGNLLATGAVFKIQIDAYLGLPHDMGAAVSFTRRRLGSLLWLGILLTLIIAIGFVLIVIPGIYLLVATCVSIPVLMHEGLKGMNAVKRSMDLVKGRWWATFGRVLVAVILYVVAAVVIGVIVGAITHSMTNPTLFLVIGGVGGAIASILVVPYTAAVANVIYVDLRVRNDGLNHSDFLVGDDAGQATAAPVAAPVASGASPSEGIAGLPGGDQPSGLS